MIFIASDLGGEKGAMHRAVHGIVSDLDEES